LYVLFVAPPIGTPPRYHWLPLAALEVSVPLPQNVAGLLGVMVGVGTVSIDTVCVLTFTQPVASVVVSCRTTEPEAAAV
jgi:hypothetical protein